MTSGTVAFVVQVGGQTSIAEDDAWELRPYDREITFVIGYAMLPG
jgi:hypothetical protein